jgi:hypothetical protein
MEKDAINALVRKYNGGNADAEDLKTLEQLIEAGEINLKDLADITATQEQLFKLEDGVPSSSLNDNFYQMLATEKRSAEKVSPWRQFFSWPVLAPKLALASLTLIAGFAAGYFMRTPPQKNEVQALTQEVSGLREMVMLSLLEKESASERLKAVSLTESMDEASSSVTDALIKTLNTDSNVNVRLAALEALLPYTKNGNVREALVRSIAKQNSPLVQVALAEAMAALQEKTSVKELEKIMRSGKTPKDVKKRIKQTIDVLT